MRKWLSQPRRTQKKKKFEMKNKSLKLYIKTNALSLSLSFSALCTIVALFVVSLSNDNSLSFFFLSLYFSRFVKGGRSHDDLLQFFETRSLCWRVHSARKRAR